jgi:hypothetical protein
MTLQDCAAWLLVVHCICDGVQRMVVNAAGGVGGFAFGALQSKNSVISICAASRLVKFVRPHRVSMNFNIAV